MSNTVWTPVAGGAAIAAAQPGLVKVSSDDTVASHLEAKLLAGVGIEFTTQNGGANETRTIALDPAAYVPATGGTFTGQIIVNKAGFSSVTISNDSTSESQLRFDTNTAARIFNLSETPLILATNATERMRIESSGNVGIGTTNPISKLDVNGSIFLSATTTETRRLEIGAGRTGNGSSFIDLIGDATYADYGARFIRTDTGPNAGTTIRHRGTGNFTLLTEEAAPFTLHTSSNERMRVDPSGHVLIGTTSSTADLAYDKKLKISGSGPALILEETDTSQMYTISALSSSLIIRDATNLAARMTIDSAGNVGIGTVPSTTLHILASSGGGILLEDESIFSESPNLTIIGKRDDSNVGQSFSGKIRLARNQTNAATSSNINLGSVLFGGNHTNSTLSNILYAASISGISEGAFNSSSDMPTGLAFYTGSTGQDGDTANVNSGDERMRIDSSGNVGIGVTNLSQKLEVLGNAMLKGVSTESRFLEIGTSRTGDGNSYLDFVTDTTYSDYGLRILRFGGANSPTHIKHRGTSTLSLVAEDAGKVTFQTDNTERMRIDSSGNVGINTTIPTKELDVNGSVNLTAATTETRSIEIGAGRTGNGSSFIDLIGDATYTNYGARFIRTHTGPNAGTAIRHRGTGNFTLITEDAAAIAFQTSGLEKMQIKNSGNVSIGNYSAAPGGRYLDIINTNSGATDFSILRLITQEAGSSNTTSADLFKRKNGQLTLSNNDDDAAAFLSFNVGSSNERMRIASNGNVGIGLSSPSELLAVSGSGYQAISLFSGSDNIRMFANGGDLGLQSVTSGNPINFQTHDGSSVAERMRIASNGNVGIGVTNPLTELDVSGNARLVGTSTESRYFEIGAGRTDNGYAHLDLIGDATYADYGARFIRNNNGPNTSTDIRHRGTGSLRFIAEDAGEIEFSTNDIERMTIDSSGDVGIGTSSPAEKLHIAGGSTTGALIVSESTSTSQYSGGGIALMNGATANDSHVLINTSIRDSDGSDSTLNINKINGNRNYLSTLAQYDLSDEFWRFFTNSTERMRIDSSGNVGIGTTNASFGNSKLKVASGITASNGPSTSPYLQLYNNNAGTDQKIWRIGGIPSGDLTFETVNDAYSASISRMRIDSSGNVGIGRSPGYKLDVNGTVNVTAIRFPDGTTMTTAA